jgi:N-acetylmuramoyl-L-alanine amidase
MKICLDAGHYGKYNRSPVVNTYYESDMNWKLHNYLKAELESHGFTVITTRPTQGKDLALSYRGKASAGCDLFLSIHSNACNTEATDYPLVIVQLDGKGDALGNKLAEVIEATMETKQDGRIAKVRGKSGGEYYGVLRGAASVKTMGMILEHSFHTNTAATKWLLNDDNLRKLAAAEAKVIVEHFGVQESPAPVKVDYAKSLDRSKAGTYEIASDDGVLNLRAGASADKQLIEAMPSGSKVVCYGYYTDKWLYVVSATGKKGFCHSGYLKKL